LVQVNPLIIYERLFVSPDAVNWTYVSEPQVPYSFIYGNGIFISPTYNWTSSSIDVKLSTDAVVWTQSSVSINVSQTDIDCCIHYIYNGNKFLILYTWWCEQELSIGIGGVVSEDGVSWVEIEYFVVPYEIFGGIVSIAYGNGTFMILNTIHNHHSIISLTLDPYIFG